MARFDADDWHMAVYGGDWHMASMMIIDIDDDVIINKDWQNHLLALLRCLPLSIYGRKMTAVVDVPLNPNNQTNKPLSM